MSQSNQRHMSLQEKIVQTLKDDTLGKLITDEDAILELVNIAIKEALFLKPMPTSYGRYEGDQDSYVVKESKKYIAEHLSKRIQETVENLFDKEVNRVALRNLVIDILPTAIMTHLSRSLNENQHFMESRVFQILEEMKASS